jgi:hypothetical protein
MPKMVKIDDSKANFVCPRCQRIYYQIDKATFDANPAKGTREAYEYKKYYHNCKRR